MQQLKPSDFSPKGADYRRVDLEESSDITVVTCKINERLMDLQLEDYSAVADIYLKIIKEITKSKSKISPALLTGIIDFLSNGHYLLASYTQINSKLRNWGGSALESRVKERLVAKSMSLFLAIGNMVDKNQFVSLYNLFNEYEKALSVSHEVRHLSANDALEFMISKNLRYNPSSNGFAHAVYLFHAGKHEEVVKEFENIACDSNSDSDRAACLIYAALTYESLGKIDKALENLLSIPVPNDHLGPAYMDYKIFKLFALADIFPERKKEIKSVLYNDLKRLKERLSSFHLEREAELYSIVEEIAHNM